MIRNRLFQAFVGLLLAGSAALGRADDLPVVGQVAVPTLGGKQFWADELLFHQWRIQRNVLTGHCRLLDEDNSRVAWGTFPQCRRKLEQIKQDRKLPAMQGEVVLVLHGLGRSRSSMDKLCEYLRKQGDYTVANVSYASTQGDIDTHARALGRIIENLDGVERVSFVAHSMGNIVIRRYLAQRQEEASIAEPEKSQAQLGRFVMLAPPNHGSTVAAALGDNPVFGAVVGLGAQQLGRDWKQLEKKLATPDFQFGIIAGGKKDGGGINPMLSGENDGTITRQTTRLAGAYDFAAVGSMHSFIINDAKALEYTLRFLQKGHFISPEARQPIAADQNPPTPKKRKQ
jgi:pimeloyl-ACP methyl ester carboxylesterase